MREITLTQNKTTQVDDENFAHLSRYRWIAQKSADGKFYAVADIKNSQTQKKERVYLHRLLMNPDEGFMVEHRDGDSLNNQQGNLQVVCNVNNNQKQGDGIHKSTYCGVNYIPCGKKKWRASITHKGKYRHLGSFSSEIEAAQARDDAAVKIWGDYAKLNLPPVKKSDADNIASMEWLEYLSKMAARHGFDNAPTHPLMMAGAAFMDDSPTPKEIYNNRQLAALLSTLPFDGDTYITPQFTIQRFPGYSAPMSDAAPGPLYTFQLHESLCQAG